MQADKEIGNKFLDGIKQNLIGSVLKHLVTFVVTIFLSRLLSPADFGLVGMSTIFITFTQALSNLGLTSGLIREKNPDEIQLNSVFYFNIGMATILGIIVFFSANTISNFYHETRIEMIVKASAPLFIFNSINHVHGALFYKKMELKVTRMGSVYGAIIAGILGIAAAFYGLGVWSLVISTYTSNTFFTIYVWSKSTWRPSLLFSYPALKKLFPFGIKVFFIEYIDQIFTRMDVVMIGRFFSPSTLGYYFRALSLNEIITKYTSQSLSGIFFPTIKKFNNDKTKILDFFFKTFRTICFISFGLTGLLFVCSNEIILVLFGIKWSESVIYFQFLAFASLVYPLGIMFNGVFLGMDRAGMQLKIELMKKTLGLLALIVGIQYGIKSYLILLLTSLFIGLFVTFYTLNLLFENILSKLVGSFFINMIPMGIGILVVKTGNFILTSHYTLPPTILLVLEASAYGLIFWLISKQIKLNGYLNVLHILKSKGIIKT